MRWWRLHHLAPLLSAAPVQWLGPCWRLSLPAEPCWQTQGSWGCETSHLPTTAFQHSLPPPYPLCNTKHSPSGLQPLDQGSRRLSLPHKPVFERGLFPEPTRVSCLSRQLWLSQRRTASGKERQIRDSFLPTYSLLPSLTAEQLFTLPGKHKMLP